MTEPDRTQELVRAMLERRAGGPVPEWLPETTMLLVRAAPRVRRGSRWRGLAPRRPGIRLALAVVPTLLLVAVVSGALVLAGFLGRSSGLEPTGPAVVVSPTASQPPSPSTLEPTTPPAAPTPSATRTPRPVPTVLTADAMAIVTEEGDRLRVRTAPGVGSDSIKLEPVQAAGTRLLVLNGPVAKDGYDWYEVRTEARPTVLHGWVAAGKNGKAWIEPTTPDCGVGLDAKAVVSLDPIDYLLCYGDDPVVLTTTAIEPWPGVDDDWCRWTGARARCVIDPDWMNAQAWLVIETGDGTSGGVGVVVPPALVPAVNAVAGAGTATFTVAADHPAARSCRIVDAQDRDVVPPTQAGLECRLLFIVLDVAPG